MAETDKPDTSQSEQKSEFSVCLIGIYELIEFNQQNAGLLTSKLKELEAIHIKRLNGYKTILHSQKIFHNANNKAMKQTTKEKNELIQSLKTEIQNLKDLLNAYQQIEAKYVDAITQLNALKK